MFVGWWGGLWLLLGFCFVLMWFERRSVPRSLFVVSLPSIRITCRFGNSFWSWFNSHNVYETAVSGRAS